MKRQMQHENSYRENAKELLETLNEAARIAELEFKNAVVIQQKAKVAFMNFDLELEKALRLIDKLKGCAPELKDELQRVACDRRKELHSEWHEWERRFETRREDLSHFNLMLFGRTMTGKSTTLEALTGGDGSSIGRGAPDFTTRINGRKWNGLHVVDTPGLEGFKPELREVAENYVDRADAILVVVSDDHIEPAILERMASIYVQNKPIAVLLNIKANSDRLLSNPARVFRDHEIQGHMNRIRGFLKEFLGFDDIPIIPYCAAAAFDAIKEKDPARSGALFHASRFHFIQDLIVQLIKERGIALRSRSAYDSMMHHFEKINDDLRERLSALQRQHNVLNQNVVKSRSAFAQIHRSNSAKLSRIKRHFYTANNKIHDFVEEVVNGDKKNPDQAFKTLLSLDTVNREISDLRASIVADIQIEMERIQSEVRFDLALSVSQSATAPDVSISLDGVTWAKARKTIGRYGRMAGTPIAGLGGGALFLYAVGNIWNPTGWAAFVAGIVSIGVSVVASKGADLLFSEVENSGVASLAKVQSSLRKKLKKKIWDLYVDINNDNYKWLCTVVEHARNQIVGALEVTSKDAAGFLTSGNLFLRELEALKFEASLMSTNAIMRLVYPKETLETFSLTAAPRRLGYRMKLVVKPLSNKSVLGKLIGAGGAKIKELELKCGNERIDLVELFPKRSVEVAAIVSALKPANLDIKDIRIVVSAKTSLEFVVTTTNRSNFERAIGTHHWNVELAEAAVGCPIRINRAA